MLQISAQYGDPKATDVFWPFHRSLNQEFESVDAEEYFETLTCLSIVLRVSGAVRDFEAEGVERLKKVRGTPELTVDLAVPENRWKGVDGEAFAAYLRTGIEAACEALIVKAEQAGEVKDPEKLRATLRAGIERVFSA